jgi:MFS family permease
MHGYIKNPTQKGWLTSIFELGAWYVLLLLWRSDGCIDDHTRVGTIYSGFLAEIISRKYAILVNTAVFMLGVIIQITAVAGGAQSILGGRFITGMGVGSLSMIVPMYNAECAPPEVRGALVGLQQLAITTGIMISFWIDYGTNYIGGTGASQHRAAWVIPLSLQLAPAMILGVGMIFMPFSPRWLVHHGRETEARATLASLRGLHGDHELIELEYLEIRAQSMFEKRSTAEHFPHLADGSAMSTIKLQFVAAASLFKSAPMFRRVALATVTMFFQQWTVRILTRSM